MHYQDRLTMMRLSALPSRRTMDSQPPKSASSRRKKWLAAVIATALASAPLGLFYYHTTETDRELGAAIAEADRVDPGWRLKDLEAKRAVIPTEENSALCVMAARSLLPRSWLVDYWRPMNEQEPGDMTYQSDPSFKGSRQLIERLRTQLANA